MAHPVTVTVNGAVTSHRVAAPTTLVEYLRDVLDLTATNEGCDTTSCGSCTVHLDGEAVKACTVLAVQAHGRSVTTVEGLAGGPGGGLHPLLEAFRAEHGVQCGYCTPGMVMAVLGLLERCPHPDEAQVRTALKGNLCRCTGYHNIVAAVLAASGATGAAGQP
ncbi:MAG TPA: (2Fe-2S)-binding protein [Acidimicrobiales bacterium]|jgi:aerobic-type carbon monoxide dehydrogenase small subunit (CoxS/CutS family)|nr:(2Fe-2S)-binding protein [Acidimicrobiales bacterium]